DAAAGADAGAAGTATGLLMFSTSALVTRPPRPLPSIWVGSTPASASILRAAGMTAGAAADLADAGATAGAAPAAAFFGAAAGLPTAASVSICAITSPEVTVAPFSLSSLIRTPSAGAGNSSTTLSVSISIRFSSRATGSPGCLCQLTRVASATDSDNCGTFTSISMSFLRQAVFLHPLLEYCPFSHRPFQRPEGPLDDRLLLRMMLGVIAHRRRGRGRPRNEEELLPAGDGAGNVITRRQPVPG